METAERAALNTTYADERLGSLAIELTSEADMQHPDQDAEVPDETIHIQYSHTATDAYPLMQKVRY